MYSSDYSDTYSDKGEEKAVTNTPRFVTEPISMLVNEGETVRLPCLVDRLEGFVLLWKRKEEILTVAKQIIDKRFRLEEERNGNSLVLGQVSPGDEGEYTCQVSAYKPADLTHRLAVRVKPIISTVPSEVLVVVEGEPASLTCRIEAGSPTPAITWHRKRLEQEVTTGQVLTWKSVTRHNAGHYVCSADNGFGPEPVTAEVKLEVHHVPHTEVEESLVHTAEGQEVKLTCTVHCSPKCEVEWQKDGTVLDTSNSNYYASSQGPTFTLTVLNVGSESFGDYSCRASNQLGSSSSTARVSGLALPAVWRTEDSHSPWEDKFFLEWTSLSKSPVESFTLEYRAEREFTWDRRDIVPVPEGDHRWQGSFTLDNLAPAARYEAKVSSRNQYGVSNFSKPFFFATKGAAPLQQPSVSGSDPATTTTTTSFLLLLLASSHYAC